MTTDTSSYSTMLSLLMDLEAAMRQFNYWQDERPPIEAFDSTTPFFMDTMTFMQWLQFVFIPRVRVLIEQQGDLPMGAVIAPMGDEYFRPLAESGVEIVSVLEKIDALLKVDTSDAS